MQSSQSEARVGQWQDDFRYTNSAPTILRGSPFAFSHPDVEDRQDIDKHCLGNMGSSAHLLRHGPLVL